MTKIWNQESTKISQKNIFIIYFKNRSSNKIQVNNRFVVKNQQKYGGKVPGSRCEQQALNIQRTSELVDDLFIIYIYIYTHTKIF